MLTDFQRNFLDLTTIIEQRQYATLATFRLIVPDQFNWVRDVFEPFIVATNGERNLLQLVNDEDQIPVTLTYCQALEKCDQLLNFLRSKGVQQKDRMFIMCGLHEGLWTSYLAAIKGGFVLIPAASILNADDIIYRFDKAFPTVIIADNDNVQKMEQALSNYKHPVAVKLLLDGTRDGWVPFDAIEGYQNKATPADTHRDEDLFWFFTSGTTGMPKVVVHTHATYPLGHLTTAAWIGLRAEDKHYNISQPGWAKLPGAVCLHR
jgi:acyl-coenzyme A synthetase/AMP-(fatty) acid ligase